MTCVISPQPPLVCFTNAMLDLFNKHPFVGHLIGCQAPSHPQCAFTEPKNDHHAMPHLSLGCPVQLHFHSKHLLIFHHFQHKPASLAHGVELVPTPFVPPDSYLAGENFNHHTAAVHRQCCAGNYVTTSSKGKAMNWICSIGQFPWCKYSH